MRTNSKRNQCPQRYAIILFGYNWKFEKHAIGHLKGFLSGSWLQHNLMLLVIIEGVLNISIFNIKQTAFEATQSCL